MNHYLNTILTKLHIPVTVENRGYKFYCPSYHQCWLAETYFEKEPETMVWIDSFASSSILWDFGANIGAYTIYAAKKVHSVVCFEPNHETYAILLKNLKLNKLQNVLAYDVAAGENTNYRPFPSPDYIKIDVDGPELAIIKGLKSILPKVRELSIELEPSQREAIITLMKENGFVIKSEGWSKMFIGTKYEKYTNAIFWRGC